MTDIPKTHYLWCWHCRQKVSTEIPEDLVFRAIAICPECIEKEPDAYLLEEAQKKIYQLEVAIENYKQEYIGVISEGNLQHFENTIFNIANKLHRNPPEIPSDMELGILVTFSPAIVSDIRRLIADNTRLKSMLGEKSDKKRES